MVNTKTPSRRLQSADRSPAAVDLHVGARIRMRRRFLGLTQLVLAESLGLTFQQVQKYERGANRVSASKLYEIARALSVPVPYFFEGLATANPEDVDEARGAERSIREFLLTSEGQELASLYPRISHPRLRRQVLELVRTIAEDDQDTA